jgi:hypothetical protein
MFVILAVVTGSALTPPAEISAVHFTAHYQYAIAACTESPHPDHDAGGLSVNSVTGAPSEFSQVSSFTFISIPPWETESVPHFSLMRTKVQTRALGAVRHAPSKMRGRG